MSKLNNMFDYSEFFPRLTALIEELRSVTASAALNLSCSTLKKV